MGILTPEDQSFFDENGYLVIRNAVPKEQCDAVIDAIWDFLGMDRNNPEDWYHLPLKPGGMVEMYQHQAMWNTRQSPLLYQVFSELHGTEKLWVSIDRVNFKPPRHPDHPDYDHKGFVHWDADTTQPHLGRDGKLVLHKDFYEKNPGSDVKPRSFWMQGVLYLADTAENQGGFQCIPGFHRNLDEWIKTQPADRNSRAPDMTNLKSVPIPGKAGDFLIWNSLLAHGNGHNVSDKPRFSQFFSMFPAHLRDNEEARQHRIRCWQEHSPPGDKTFPGDPRRIEETTFPTAELTPLGRKLLGVDAWD